MRGNVHHKKILSEFFQKIEEVPENVEEASVDYNLLGSPEFNLSEHQLENLFLNSEVDELDVLMELNK
jgi:hypothetical protein